MARYEFSDGSSSKFWEIVLEGSALATTYGRIGSSGQTNRKEFDSNEKAAKEHDKLIAEKVKKGYVLVGEPCSDHRDAPEAPKASRPKKSAASRSTPVDGASVIAKIKRALATLPTTVDIAYGTPASESQIVGMTEAIGCKFPQPYVAFLKEFGALRLSVREPHRPRSWIVFGHAPDARELDIAIEKKTHDEECAHPELADIACLVPFFNGGQRDGLFDAFNKAGALVRGEYKGLADESTKSFDEVLCREVIDSLKEALSKESAHLERCEGYLAKVQALLPKSLEHSIERSEEYPAVRALIIRKAKTSTALEVRFSEYEAKIFASWTEANERTLEECNVINKDAWLVRASVSEGKTRYFGGISVEELSPEHFVALLAHDAALPIEAPQMAGPSLDKIADDAVRREGKALSQVERHGNKVTAHYRTAIGGPVPVTLRAAPSGLVEASYVGPYADSREQALAEANRIHQPRTDMSSIDRVVIDDDRVIVSSTDVPNHLSAVAITTGSSFNPSRAHTLGFLRRLRERLPPTLNSSIVDTPGLALTIQLPRDGATLEIRFNNATKAHERKLFLMWTEPGELSLGESNAYNQNAWLVRASVEPGRTRYRGGLASEGLTVETVLRILSHDAELPTPVQESTGPTADELEEVLCEMASGSYSRKLSNVERKGTDVLAVLAVPNKSLSAPVSFRIANGGLVEARLAVTFAGSRDRALSDANLINRNAELIKGGDQDPNLDNERLIRAALDGQSLILSHTAVLPRTEPARAEYQWDLGHLLTPLLDYASLRGG